MGDFLALHIGDNYATYALCDEQGIVKPDTEGKAETHTDGSMFDFLHALQTILGPFEGKIDRIGVSVQGPFDYRRGVFPSFHKFTAMRGQDLSRFIKSYGMQPVFLNDTNAFLIGELRYGAAKNHPSCCCVTLGTTFGFTLASRGKVLVDEGGMPCFDLGAKPFREGVVENYISRQAMRREYHQLSGFPDLIDVEEIDDRAVQGDFWARRVFNDAGTVIATVLRTYVPRKYYGGFLLLGGQIARASRFIAPPIANLLGIEVSQAMHLDDATLRGIGAYVVQGADALTNELV